MTIKQLSWTLYDARWEAGLSQEALAEKLGVSQPLIAQWEAGAKRPSLARLEQMAKILPRLEFRPPCLFYHADGKWGKVAI